MDTRRNPLFDRASIEATSAPRTAAVTRRIGKTELVKQARRDAARDVLPPLVDGEEVLILGDGSFSLIDLLSAILEQVGPAHVDISTWTAAHADISEASEMVASGRLASCRWLVDRSFQRRQPAFLALLLERFGRESVRVANSHAKMCLISTPEIKIVILTSANLNRNLRAEYHSVRVDDAVHGFMKTWFDGYFAR